MEKDQRFTRYVRALAQGDDTAVEAQARLILLGLRRLLRGVLRRRGMWQQSPRYFGIVGWERWQSHPEEAGALQDALEELVYDAYEYIFLDRFSGMVDQLEDKPHIEGLVALNVNHFVLERQMRHDRVGSRIYRVLRDALGAARQAGDVHGATEASMSGIDDVLVVAGEDEGATVDGPRIDQAVATWCDRLMPALVTASKNYGKLIDDVRSLVLDLPRQGVHAFRLRDLSRSLGREARSRWQAIWEVSATMTRSDRRTPGARRDFEALAARVERGIGTCDARKNTRALMLEIWRLVVAWADDEASSIDTASLFGSRMPSERRLADALGVTRARIQTARDQLRAVVERCRAELASRRGPERDATGWRLPPDVASSRIESLTRRSIAAAAQAMDERRAVSLESRRVGEVLHARNTAAAKCEWVVLTRDDDGGRLYVVPADGLGLVGRDDVSVQADEPGGPLTLRCRLATWVDAARLAQRPSRRVQSSVVDQALHRVRDAGENDLNLEDPELLAWIRTLRAEVEALSGGVDSRG